MKQVAYCSLGLQAVEYSNTYSIKVALAMGYQQFGLAELTAVNRWNDCQNTAFQGAIARCPKKLYQFKC